MAQLDGRLVTCKVLGFLIEGVVVLDAIYLVLVQPCGDLVNFVMIVLLDLKFLTIFLVIIIQFLNDI